ncbi:MAG: GTPase [Candidatus Ratteibacteria bacterium]|nr:GTPase [Candidatus Ratteibacteria bacterium]
MPANLTPQYLEAEKYFREAKTKEEKLVALEEMYALLPKHKGTDKLKAQIKQRISKLKKTEDKKAAKASEALLIEREGAGQLALVGPPNSGKSSLLAALTKAKPKVGPYPFTTTLPFPGIMEYEDIQIQLVDLPPITDAGLEGWHFNTIRNCNALLFVVDTEDADVLSETEEVIEQLKSRRVKLVKKGGEKGAPVGTVYKETLLIANKMDSQLALDNLSVLEEFFGDKFRIMPLSILDDHKLEKLKKNIFSMLKIIRVYSKPPGKPPDLDKPFTLPLGSSVTDLAKAIHKDFTSGLEKARLWGSARFNGQAVPYDYVLKDKDIVELHIKKRE